MKKINISILIIFVNLVFSMPSISLNKIPAISCPIVPLDLARLEDCLNSTILKNGDLLKKFLMAKAHLDSLSRCTQSNRSFFDKDRLDATLKHANLVLNSCKLIQKSDRYVCTVQLSSDACGANTSKRKGVLTRSALIIVGASTGYLISFYPIP